MNAYTGVTGKLERVSPHGEPEGWFWEDPDGRSFNAQLLHFIRAVAVALQDCTLLKGN